MSSDEPVGPTQEQIDAARDDFAAWKRDRPEEETEPQDDEFDPPCPPDHDPSAWAKGYGIPKRHST